MVETLLIMPNPIRPVLFILVLSIIGQKVHSQVYLGAGYGTFNVPGASMKFRGYGPTFRFEYTKPDYKVSMFVDVSYFQNSIDGGTTQIYDNNGVPVGMAAVTDKYTFIYNTIGFKTRFSERKVSFYLGAGAAIVYAKQTPSFQPSYNVSGQGQSMWDEGFHFNAGVQYNTGPVMLQLQGNLDIVLKVLVDDVSNVMTNLRLTATVPVFR
jgi:hypothetical protein